jgi:putative ABC transport system permease protein
MDLLRTLMLRVRSLLGVRSLEDELSHELEFHVSMQAAQYAAEGMPAGDARRRALLEFGGVDRLAEECREVRTGATLHGLLRTVRLSLRRLRREPGFAVPAVATIALGTCALAAIFSVVDAVLLRPLPYPDADRIVELRHTLPGWGIAETGQSGGTFAQYRSDARVFESIGAWFDRELSITETEAPERVVAALVTHGVLEVLGVQPLHGRRFTDTDGGGNAVMLSHAFWLSRYGGDSTVVGRQVKVNGVAREIIGVLPPRTDFPRAGTQMLFGMGSGEAREGDLRNMYMEAVARLRPGVTPEQAEADLVRLVNALPERFDDVTAADLAESGLAPRVRTLKESVVGGVRPALVLLLCTALFVLVIAVANVLNLVLVRAERQRREVAIERALGAGGGAVALRFIIEYAAIALAGAALGTAVAAAVVHAGMGFDAWQLPRAGDAAVSLRTVAVVAAAALVAAALCAVVGIASTARVDVQATLRGSQRMTATRRSRAAQNALSAVQVALAAALLTGAALMVQSLWRVARVPLGFAAEGVVAFDVALPVRQYSGYTAQAAFHERLVRQLENVPGVSAAGAVSVLPLTPMQNWFDVAVTVPGSQQSEDAAPLAAMRSATPGYFAAMGIPLLRGRTFDAHDLGEGGAGVVLSAALAQSLFGSVDVVGRNVELTGESAGTLRIVGIAADVRDASLTAPAARLIYLPATGDSRLAEGRAPIPIWPSELTHVVRSALPASEVLAAARAALHELDPTLPLAFPRTMPGIVSASGARLRVTSWLLLAAAASALLLGVVGIYGVVSYTVSRRRAELALRMALGATPAGVTRSVLRQGAAIAALGLAAGLPVALLLARLLSSLLFEVSPQEPRAFALVALLLLVVAVLASGVPALRAARTDPLRALTPD